MKYLKKTLKYLSILILLFLLWMFVNAIRIYKYADTYVDVKSEVAIVLGAGTSNGKLSPVFRERINHSINLFKQGKVRYIIFTGGFGKGQSVADSEVAMRYAIQNGIPENKILLEKESTITYTNLINAKRIMELLGLQTALLVSDPLHMKRSMAMAENLGINCQPSPTPTTMYRSKSTKLKSLIYESFFYNLGIVQGYFK